MAFTKLWFPVLNVPFGPFLGRPQVIQTVSAVDKDEPLSGHRFYFTLAPPVAGNPNFTLRDNKGDSFSFDVIVIVVYLLIYEQRCFSPSQTGPTPSIAPGLANGRP